MFVYQELINKLSFSRVNIFTFQQSIYQMYLYIAIFVIILGKLVCSEDYILG